MPVNITWSSTNGGTALSSTVDHGTDDVGETLSSQEFYLRHDGTNQITDAGLFLAVFSDTYTGGASAALDLAELVEWGDATDADDFGGYQFNFDATGGYVGQWPTSADKFGSAYNVVRTGAGDTETNRLLLPVETGVATAGVVPTGSSPNVRFRCRVELPTNEDTAGKRQFDLRLRYNYTS